MSVSEILALAGTMPDREIGRRLGVGHERVGRVRRAAGIGAYTPPLPDHGTHARWRRGCRCEECLEARARIKAAAWKTHPHLSQSMSPDRSQALVELHRQDQVTTRRAAEHDREPWSGEDLAVAGDYTLSAVQVAHQLGRSLASVRHVRRKHKLRVAWLSGSSGVQPYGRRGKRA